MHTASEGQLKPTIFRSNVKFISLIIYFDIYKTLEDERLNNQYFITVCSSVTVTVIVAVGLIVVTYCFLGPALFALLKVCKFFSENHILRGCLFTTYKEIKGC